MATTRAPLFSLDAAGRLGRSVVFSRWRGRTYVRKLVKPKNPKSTGQIAVRAVARFNGKYYTSLLSAGNKTDWINNGKPTKITGLNAWLRDSQLQRRLEKCPRNSPLTAAGSAPAVPTALTATAAKKAVSLSWTNAAGPPFLTQLHIVTGATITGSSANLYYIVPTSVTAITISGLISAQQYTCAVVHGEVGGVRGTFTAGVSFTPT